MLFWILLLASVLFLSVPVIFYRTLEDIHDKVFCSFMAGLICVPVALFFFSIPYSGWVEYVVAYSKVVSQSEVISVYEERISSLKTTLSEISYPQKSDISLDADTPWASLIASLTEAERELALAKKVRAEALRDIEAWKRGPMSGVVTFVGEPGNE